VRLSKTPKKKTLRGQTIDFIEFFLTRYGQQVFSKSRAQTDVMTDSERLYQRF
jgi:hypothetical protein